jgi:hypothetical protein
MFDRKRDYLKSTRHLSLKASMETPQDTQNDSYSHTRHTKRQLQLQASFSSGLFIYGGCVPRLTFNKDMALIGPCIDRMYVCTYVCWINMTVAFLHFLPALTVHHRDSAQLFYSCFCEGI